MVFEDAMGSASPIDPAADPGPVVEKYGTYRQDWRIDVNFLALDLHLFDFCFSPGRLLVRESW